MNKTGIIYSFNTTHTKKAAELISKEFGNEQLTHVNAETLTEEEFLKFDRYILGVPTWFDGELPNYWDEFVPALRDMNLKDKIFAVFGMGNQVEYPENFGDAVGLMVEILESAGAKITGFTSTEGYNYEKSRAERNGQFVGLVLDIENQSEQMDKRIADWVNKLNFV